MENDDPLWILWLITISAPVLQALPTGRKYEFVTPRQIYEYKADAQVKMHFHDIMYVNLCTGTHIGSLVTRPGMSNATPQGAPTGHVFRIKIRF